MTESGFKSTFSLPALRGDALGVTNGANLGDSLSFAEELVPDDIYQIAANAKPARLSLMAEPGGTFRIAPTTAVGLPGATVHLDCCLTLMSAGGQTTELLVMVEVDDQGDVAEIYALPLDRLEPKVDYALVTVDRDSAREKLAQIACVSFTAGTQITMASGAQRPIEELNVGDKVLTRDDGPQAVRWIGRTTVRAVGEFAPILIKAGTLHNDRDLVVSPEHRLFIYQRSDALGAGRSEVLVRARHLVNGTTVTRKAGGFVDYYQVLFDSHQIIYAEGIAAETLLVDTRTRPALPQDLAEKLSAALPGHEDRPHLKFEVAEGLLDHPDAADLLRRASTR